MIIKAFIFFKTISFNTPKPSSAEVNQEAVEAKIAKVNNKQRNFRSYSTADYKIDEDDETDPNFDNIMANLESIDNQPRHGQNFVGKDDDEFEEMDEEKMDQQEMLEFQNRLLEKDLAKTKKVGSIKDINAQMTNSVVKHNQEVEEKLNKMNDLREKSRIQYLKKREGEKIEDLELELADEQNIFGQEDLTSREKQSIEHKKKILEIAKEFKESQVIFLCMHFFMNLQG